MLLYQQNQALRADVTTQQDALHSIQRQVTSLEQANADDIPAEDIAAAVTALANDVNDVNDVKGRMGQNSLGDYRSLSERLDDVEAALDSVTEAIDGVATTANGQASRVQRIESDLRGLCLTLSINTDLIITC